MACTKFSINARFPPTSICSKSSLFNSILLDRIQNVWNVYTTPTFLDIKNKRPLSPRTYTMISILFFHGIIIILVPINRLFGQMLHRNSDFNLLDWEMMPSGHLPMKSETTNTQNKAELPGGRQDSRIAESEPASVQPSIKAVTILAKLSKSTFWELCKLAKGLQPSEESLFQKKEKLLNLGKKTRDWDILTWVNPVYLLPQLHSISLESYQPCSHQRDRWALELLPKPSAQTTVTVWPDSQLPERATFTGCCVFDSLGAELHRKGPVSRALMETISFRYLTFCLTNNAILIGAHKSLAKYI